MMQEVNLHNILICLIYGLENELTTKQIDSLINVFKCFTYKNYDSWIHIFERINFERLWSLRKKYPNIILMLFFQIIHSDCNVFGYLKNITVHIIEEFTIMLNSE